MFSAQFPCEEGESKSQMPKNVSYRRQKAKKKTKKKTFNAVVFSTRVWAQIHSDMQREHSEHLPLSKRLQQVLKPEQSTSE